MQSLGYRHICDFLNKNVSFDDTVSLLKRDTRRYAKRRFTWFGKDKKIVWIKPDEREKAGQCVKDFFPEQRNFKI